MQRDPHTLKHALELIVLPFLIECAYLIHLIYGVEMKFFSAIGSFFKRLFTKHNAVGAAVTIEHAAQTAADVASGNIPAAITEAVQTVDAARSITAVDKAPAAPAPTTASPSAPILTVVPTNKDVH